MKRQLYFLTKVFSAFVLTIVFWTTSFAQTLQADKDALIVFYNATGGASWTTKTNWLVGDPSTWSGVTVTNGRVTSLSLIGNNLNGTIPVEFKNLTALKTIKLSQNSLGGTMDISLMSGLERIEMSNNAVSWNLTVNVNTNYYPNLNYLLLSSSKLNGVLDIRGMPSLINVDVSSSTVSSVTANISTNYYPLLAALELSQNAISGLLDISNMKSLNYLSLSGNGAVWSLKTNSNPSYYTSLTTLNLYNTKLTGSVDVSGMPLLVMLDLRVNTLTSLSTNHSSNYYNALKYLRLTSNSIGGTIDISNMLNIEEYAIENNQIENITFGSNINLYTSLIGASVNGNRLTFEDLEFVAPKLFTAGHFYAFNNQAQIGTERTVYVTEGSVLSLNIPVGGTANRYQWFKNGTSLGAPSANPILTINPAVPGTAGDYTLQVTNTIVSPLTLSSYPIHVVITPPCLEKNPIDGIYPALGNSVSISATEMFKWNVNKVPALNPPTTDNKNTLVLQVAPPAYDPVTGREYPDWANKTEQLFSYPTSTPLTIGEYTAAISSLVTAGLEEKVYFWRVGIRYIVPSGGNDPVLWSEPLRFTVKPDYNSFAGYLASETQHTNKINWVYEATFMDAGMTSQSINYVDGLGKSRQIQGLSNAASSGGGVQGNVICQEVAYSEEGGGAVQSMSAPIGRNTFAYEHRFFDVNDNGTLRDFSTKDFDREVITSSTDRSLIAPTTVEVNASNTRGVGYYYSNFNTLEPYVDNASGYAYSYTASYKDPLGLGMMSSGAGSTFRMNAGREVKSYYGQPSQEELNRIYGPAAPIARNINKTTTYDPNGVGSITYTDNEGKTIATAITVCNAPNMEALTEDGTAEFNSVVNVMLNDNVDLNALNKTATSKFTTSCTNQPVKLNYKVTLGTFNINQAACANCKYDFSIRIIEDASGKEIYKNTTQFNPTLQCGSSTLNNLLTDYSISVSNPGTYTVIRTIDPMKEANGKTVVENMIDQEITYLNTHLAEYRTKFDQEMSGKEEYYLLRQKLTGINRNGPRNTNLIPNGDFSQGNTGFTTEYRAYYSGITPPFYYAVSDNSANTMGAFYDIHDHTSSKGNFLILDSPTQLNPATGKYYVAYSVTVNVKQNTNYNFRAWFNALEYGPSSTPPNIRLYINNVAIGSAFNPSQKWTWLEMAQSWNSGSSTTATITILNDYLEGNGNDFGLDDISLMEAGCEEQAATLTLNIPKPVNLAKNGDFSLGNKNFTSDYTFTPIALSSSQGYYNVERNGSKLNSSYSGSDNTSGNGRFLMVDGHGTANKTIWQQQIDVTPSTSYNFSFSLASISAASMPIGNRATMRVYINNVVVGSAVPAPGILDTWSRLLYTWNSGSSTTATIRIVDVSVTSTGNDFGIDDIVFAKTEYYNVVSGSADLFTTPIASRETELATAQAIVSQLNAQGTGFTPTAGTTSDGKACITFKASYSFNNFRLGIGTRYYDTINGYVYDYSQSSGVLSGGIPSNTCNEQIFVADKVDLTINQDGTGTLIGGDGRISISQVPGLENYNLSSIAEVTSTYTPQNLSTVKNIFKDSYYSASWRSLDLNNDVTSFQIFSVSGPNLSSSQIALLNDQLLLSGTLGNYYLVKVKLKGQTCTNQCAAVLDNSSCRNTCDQQRDYLYNALLETKAKAQANPTVIWPAGGWAAKTLATIILPDNPGLPTTYYPNVPEAYIKEMVNYPEVYDLFNEYKDAQGAYDAFNFQQCVNQCEHPSQDPCNSCELEYVSCVRENANNLSLGHEYLMTKWNTNEGVNDPFPYVLTDLKDAQGKENSTERENLGTDLFNALIVKLQNAEAFVEADWNAVTEITTSNCTNCSSPGSSTFGCQGKSVPMNAGLLFPTKLISILQSANQKCLDSYNNDCFNVTDPAKTESYMCGKNVQNCIDMYDPGSGLTQTQHNTNCSQQYNCPVFDALGEQKKSMIREALAPYYLDVTILEQQVSIIYSQYYIKAIQDLSQYLALKVADLNCAKKCEDFNNALFLSWLELQKDKIRTTIRTNFINQCFGAMNELFTVTYPQRIYHYTLFNYDRANNLIATVPPEGVDFVNTNGTETPVHVLQTTYKLSSVGEILSSTTPDGGTATYLYDKASRIRFSQTAEQVQRGTDCRVLVFSYTKYDVETGRISEIGEQRYSGQVTSGSFKRPAPSAPVSFISDNVNSTTFPTNSGFERTNFFYDTPETVDGVAQTYTNRRVTKSVRDNAVTYYSYDGHGRVKWYKQYLPETGYKTTEYEFLPVSSRVEKIWYQKGVAKEQFTHRYFYDTDQRITTAEISTDNGTTWNPAGKYAYYTHGNMKEVGFGNNIQRMNYTYNLQGWIKAINHVFAANDPGKDGVAGSGSQYSKDVFGMILNYYTGDYQRTGTELTSTASIMPGASSAIKTAGKDLFNGNITGTISYTGHDQTSTSTAESLMGSGYKYDYLNRLVGATRELKTVSGFTPWSQTLSVQKYAEFYAYDANGNITSGGKYANTAVIMDYLSYKYDNFQNETTTKKTSNRLLHVNDDGPDWTNYEDIVNQGTMTQLSNANYTYDAKGRLISDKKNEIAQIVWTIYDKVASVRRTTGSLKPDLYFTYDPAGRRLTKKVVYPTASDTRNKTTYYVYEASGILMAVYDRQDNVTPTIPNGMTSVKINFQPSSVTNPPAGYLPDNGAVYANRGNGYSYGWDVANPTGTFVSSKAYPDLTNQTYMVLKTSSPAATYTWELGLTNGTYNVKIITGRPDISISSRVTVEGTVYIDPDGAGATDNFDEYNLPITITDGKLTITTNGNNVPISSVEVTSTGLPATVYEYTLKEQYVYGAARLGAYNRGQSLNSGAAVVAFSAASLSFELTDHLGNTRATVSGQKNTDGSAQILYLADYYAFGMVMPNGREFKASGGDYRFGFNGKEDDDETSWQDYGFRMYDPRIGRFFSVDPLQWAYPELTPYQFAANMPIWMVDLDGLEPGEAPITGVQGPMSYSGNTPPSQTAFLTGTHIDNEITVSPTIPDAPTYWEYMGDGFNNVVRKSEALLMGAVHQMHENNVSPMGKRMYFYNGVDQSSYEQGRLLGNLLTLIQAGYEFGAGGAAILGGGLSTATGVGSVPGVIAVAGGYVVVTDAAFITKNALLNMSGINDTNDELHNGSNGNSNSKNSTRIGPDDLEEQLTLAEAKSGSGNEIMQGKINDKNYPASDWAKMEHNHPIMGRDPNTGKEKVVKTITIHYWKNRHTGAAHGFKFTHDR